MESFNENFGTLVVLRIIEDGTWVLELNPSNLESKSSKPILSMEKF